MWIALWLFVTNTDPATLSAHQRLTNATFHERAERFASAYRELSLAKEALKRSPDTDLRQLIETRASRLAPRVGYRMLDVKVMATDISIEQDGVPVPTFEWGHAEPIDGGPHVWTAKMGGVEFWRFAGIVSEGAQLVVSPSLPYMPPSDDPPPRGGEE